MLSVADATRTVLERMRATSIVDIPVADGAGRVLAHDLVASRPLPGFDNSAMDGYAARASELPATLPVAGVVGAGDRGTPLAAGTAMRIFTGAPLPPGADTVVMQEDVTREGDRVALPASPLGDNIRRAGEDIAVGAIVHRAGTRLRPWDLTTCAALGCATLAVRARPRVAILATGDELVDVETEPQFGQLVASTRYALAAMIREAGGEPFDLGIVRDDLASITSSIERGLAYDVVITTGGVSVGDRDFVHAAFAAAKIELELYKVAIKPGKPFSFATTPTAAIFGLPGNPVSSLVAFELFVRPALLAMQGASITARKRATVTLANPYRKAAGRAHYVRARVEGSIAYAHPKQGSAMLSALADTNALVELVAERGDVMGGEVAEALLLETT